MKRIKHDLKVTKRRGKPKTLRPSVQNSLATDFRALLGIGLKGPINPNPKFTNEDQLWKKDVD